jgi:glutamine cyclotransferase
MRKGFEDLEVGDEFMADGEKYLVSGVGRVRSEHVVFASPAFGEGGPDLYDEFYAFTVEDVDFTYTESSLKRLNKSDLIEIVLELQGSM